MKYKTTAREVKEGYYYVIEAGYCDLQTLLYFESPIAYAKGVYGWNFDVYQINGSTCICTGYRGMPSKNTKKDYSLIREYEEKARKIDSREGRTKLINEFVEKMKKAS
jgi:hypothetical protein